MTHKNNMVTVVQPLNKTGFQPLKSIKSTY